MSALDGLLLVALATAVVMFLFGNRPWAGFVAVLLYGVQMGLLAVIGGALLEPGTAVVSHLTIGVAEHLLGWRMQGFGWFFAFVTAGAAIFSALFAAGEWGVAHKRNRLLQGNLALNVFAMYVLLASGDLLSLFIGWELVSWAGYLMMAQAGGRADGAAYRYLLYALAGAMAVFAALALIYVEAGSLQFEAARDAIAALAAGVSPHTVWAIVLLTFFGFGVKMAVLPFHLWQAEAYAETPGPGAAFLGAISSRMGLFAMMVVLVKLVGLPQLIAMEIDYTLLSARDAIAWIGALTIVIPTFIALTQNDARNLLAWHGIGQGGYMLLGIMVGTPLGVAGGILHVFNHATYQAALFLSVTAVAHRTGTTNLDHLGGLINRMPLSYVAMLLGIMGLAGMPPMNGFVSKWMIYKSLLDEGMPLLFVAAVIGTLGTILSVYKLIHNTFLGQLRPHLQQVREVPWTMTVPMVGLGAIAFLTGFMPGPVLDLVNMAQVSLGFEALPHHLGGVATATGSLNMLWVVGVLLAAIGIGAGVFFLGGKRIYVHQYDNYAGGHFLDESVPYHYSHNFYAGLMRTIGPWYRGTVQWLESGVVAVADLLAALFAGFYRAAHTPLYLLGAAVLCGWWVVG